MRPGRCWNIWLHFRVPPKARSFQSSRRLPRNDNAPPIRRADQTDWLTSLQSLLATVVIAVFVITYIVQAFQIPSVSMENTLLIGDYLLVDKLCYGGSWELADSLPPDPARRHHRVSLPGESVAAFCEARDWRARRSHSPGEQARVRERRAAAGTVRPVFKPERNFFRDDFPRLDVLDPGINADWWVQMPKLVEDGQLIVPEGHYFAMGDNRDDSSDSRYWGFVPRENIVGRPLLIYWSIRDLDSDLPIPASVGDRLYHFAYAVTHFFQITRWDRTFRVVS